MSKVLIVVLGLLLGLLGLGVWVALGLIGVGVGSLAIFKPLLPVYKLLAQQAWNVATSKEILALPLFILMAEILFRTRLSESLFSGLAPWTHRIPGRMSHITVLASTLFAAVSGSSAATTATVGRITATELLNRGYDRRMVLGSLAGSGTLGFLIPPSVIMIIYGVLAEESILKLFLAGVIPGILLAGSYMAYLGTVSLLKPSVVGSPPPPMTLGERFAALFNLLPVLMLILCVIGSMYGGIASPTEAAAVGVLGSLLIGAFQRTITLKNLCEAFLQASRTISMIGLIIIGAVFLSVALGYLGVPRFVAGVIQPLELSPFMLILVLIIFYGLLGCVMEGMSAIVMTLSITLPLVLDAGYDKVWFGVFIVLVVEMAQITPPVGFNLFVIQGLTGDTISSIARAALPFFLIMVILTIVLAVFPELATWLPETIKLRG